MEPRMRRKRPSDEVTPAPEVEKPATGNGEGQASCPVDERPGCVLDELIESNRLLHASHRRLCNLVKANYRSTQAVLQELALVRKEIRKLARR
jgi:hypothetical protein